MITIYYSNKKYAKQIEYVFSVMFSILKIEYEVVDQMCDENDVTNILITYAQRKPISNYKYHLHIQESNLFYDYYCNKRSMPQCPLCKTAKGLPVIYGQSDAVDIIASSFFMLTRYEEYFVEERDWHGRFPANASLAYKEGFLDRPIVNEYIELLWHWIDDFGLNIKRKNLWGNNNFAVCLTHDIDALYKYRSFLGEFKRFLSMLIKHYKSNEGLNWFLGYLKTAIFKHRDPFWTFDFLREIEKRYNSRASYYFLCGGESPQDNNYFKYQSTLTGLIDQMERDGNEVGLHPSYYTFNNPKLFWIEKQKLDALVSNHNYGGRQHYLRFKMPVTLRLYEQLGLSYDTTLGYADYEGFRCGICHPFKPFDLVQNRILDIWEIPLIIMEGTLYKYRKIPSEQIANIISLYIDRIRKYQGVFVLLWHNSSFDEQVYPQAKQIYETILQKACATNALITSGREIIDKWKNK